MWKEKTSWGSLQINILMLWVLTELILLYNLWIDHVVSCQPPTFLLHLSWTVLTQMSDISMDTHYRGCPTTWKTVELWAYKYAEKNILQPHPTNFNSIITSVSWESSINLALHPYSIHFLTRFISLQNARIKPAEESRVSEAYNDLSFFSLGTPYVSTAKIARL